jgi:hypothetical protein
MTSPDPDVHGPVTGEVFRLYRPEWVVLHVVTVTDNQPRAAMLTAAQAHFEDKYAGRVNVDDVRFVCFGREQCGSCDAGLPQSCTCPEQQPDEAVQVQVHLPTLKGEFKYAILAAAHAEAEGFEDWTIVVRDSEADHELRGYGVRKLAAP